MHPGPADTARDLLAAAAWLLAARRPIDVAPLLEIAADLLGDLPEEQRSELSEKH
jgi:hypothetical protein